MNKELATALLKAQGEMGKLLKDSSNPHFNSTYASLAAVLDTVRGPLTNAGLVLYQAATTEDNNVLVHSMLIHAETGEFIEEVLPLPVIQKTPQALGSAITYGRRYLAMAMCGLAPDDDDGEEGSKQPRPVVKPQPKPQPPAPVAQHRPPPIKPVAKPQPTPDLSADVDMGMSGQGFEDIPSVQEREAVMLDVAVSLLHDNTVQLTEYASRLIATCRNNHKTSGDKKLSTANKDGTGAGQYGLLAGKVDKIVGGKYHGIVLSALCGYEVSKENPPGWKLKELIDWLNDEQYKVATEQAIKDIWAAIKSAEDALTSA